MNYKEAYKRFQQAGEIGYAYQHDGVPAYYEHLSYRNSLDVDAYHLIKNPEFKPPYAPKKGSCDDGPFNGPFLGGIGASNYSRDTLGYFNRWHLQQGVHIFCGIDTAYLMVSWEQGGKTCFKKLRISEDGFEGKDVRYAALFPRVYEHYDSEDMPFTLLMEYYSPMIPHNFEDSILPVTLFNFYVEPKTDAAVKVTVGMCWPNLLGWRHAHVTSEQRQECLWPTMQNAGNHAYVGEKSDERCHIVQSKTFVGEMTDMLGNVVISASCDQGEITYDASFRESAMTTGYENKDQLHTILKMEYDMQTEGKLSNSDVTWEAHWHEPIASAVAVTMDVKGEETQATLALTMDMPISSFGMGRNWYKGYTDRFAQDCSKSLELADYALDKNAEWITEIDAFHAKRLKEDVTISEKLVGAQINELSFVAGGGSILVTGPVTPDPETEKLGNGWHFGLLEGFDTGYYYYNTLDLYVYSFIALTRNWPELAKICFNDYLTSATLVQKQQNMVYRKGELVDNLVYSKLPHDLGGGAEDPFVRLNSYVFRDDPNMWKDHNPSFIGSFYLHKHVLGEAITEEEYEQLKVIAEFVMEQDVDDIGVPRHCEFGDSTWDNLDMKGVSIFEGGLCLGAWAIMQKIAESFYDDETAAIYYDKLEKAKKSVDMLWNGKYYNTTEYGKYCRATMADSLFGVIMAKKAGIDGLLPEEKIQSHLKHLYQNNVLAYQGGKYGPLLVAEPGRLQYEKDGGDELQVNEVLIGTAWILISSLQEYGLTKEASDLCANMITMLYEMSGCQFKTPAAWNNVGQFRAPLNMRPLSIWML